MTNPFQPQGPGFGTGQGGADVNRLHDQDDRDISILSHHHTLGIFPAQASPGDHIHDGKQSKKLAYANLTGLPTVPVASVVLPVDERGYGIVPAIGVSTAYARADHSHGGWPSRNLVHLFSNTANTGAVAATPDLKDVMGDATFTAIAGRKYRFRYSARAQSSVAPGNGDFRIRGNNSAVSPTTASTQLAGATCSHSIANGPGAYELTCEQLRECPSQLAAGVWTIAAFYVWIIGASGTFTATQSTGELRELTVDDVT